MEGDGKEGGGDGGEVGGGWRRTGEGGRGEKEEAAAARLGSCTLERLRQEY